MNTFAAVMTMPPTTAVMVSPIIQNKRGKIISKEQRILIVNMFKKYREEDDNKLKKRSMTELSYVIAGNTGVSAPSISKILSEYVRHQKISSPNRSRQRSSTIDILEETDKIELRQLVYCFYFRNELPSLNKLRKAVFENEKLPNMSKGTLYRVLQQMQFRYVRRKNHSILVESLEVTRCRRNFLRSIRHYRNENRPIFYLDETSVSAGISAKSKSEVTSSVPPKKNNGPKKSTKPSKTRSKNNQIIVMLHIGNEDGFLEDAAFVYQFEKTKDCNEMITADTFEEWFNQILPNLPPQSVIVLDNAPYHSRVSGGIPNANTKTSEIIQWLEKQNIPYDGTMVRAELLQLVIHSKVEKTYVIDDMAENMDHTVLRLPPYHSELTPIELIWSKIKAYITKYNTPGASKDVQTLFAEAVSRITADVWKKCVRHVRDEIEPKMWQLDDLIDQMMEPVIDISSENIEQNDNHNDEIEFFEDEW